MIAGFEVPTAGEILIDGQPMSSACRPKRGRPTWCSRATPIFPHLNVARERRLWPAQEGPRARPKSRRRSSEALGADQAGAATASAPATNCPAASASAWRSPARSSAGPRCCCSTSRWAPSTRSCASRCRSSCAQLQRTVGITFVFVTHDQEEALALSDRIAVMSRGKALQIDVATRLYEAPNCREVAEFIGSMNFFPGTLRIRCEWRGGWSMPGARPSR